MLFQSPGFSGSQMIQNGTGVHFILVTERVLKAFPFPLARLTPRAGLYKQMNITGEGPPRAALGFKQASLSRCPSPHRAVRLPQSGFSWHFRDTHTGRTRQVGGDVARRSTN